MSEMKVKKSLLGEVGYEMLVNLVEGDLSSTTPEPESFDKARLAVRLLEQRVTGNRRFVVNLVDG